MAPVKAPFSCPNSSLSSSPAGIAAQLSLMKVRSRRGLSRWMARASSSLPVPVSPWMSTVAVVGATVSICLRTLRRPALSPTISSKRFSRLISSSRYCFSWVRRSRSSEIWRIAVALLTAMATCTAICTSRATLRLAEGSLVPACEWLIALPITSFRGGQRAPNRRTACQSCLRCRTASLEKRVGSQNVEHHWFPRF